jgi:hypothetical protein
VVVHLSEGGSFASFYCRLVRGHVADCLADRGDGIERVVVLGGMRCPGVGDDTTMAFSGDVPHPTKRFPRVQLRRVSTGAFSLRSRWFGVDNGAFF